MLIINPGAGPVRGLRLSMRSAKANLRSFLALMPEGSEVKQEAKSLDGHGRLAVTLCHGARKCDVDIPACALRHLQSSTSFPPRLYVDGNSWMWKYAVEIAKEALGA